MTQGTTPEPIDTDALRRPIKSEIASLQGGDYAAATVLLSILRRALLALDELEQLQRWNQRAHEAIDRWSNDLREARDELHEKRGELDAANAKLDRWAPYLDAPLPLYGPRDTHGARYHAAVEVRNEAREHLAQRRKEGTDE